MMAASLVPSAAGLQASALTPVPEIVPSTQVASTGRATSVPRQLPALRPVSPTVRTYPVAGVSRQGAATLGPTPARRAETSYAALSKPEPVTGLGVTGATWTGVTPAGLALAIRTATGNVWSSWTPMAYDVDHGPDVATAEAADDKAGSDAVVVGDVDFVQLRATTDTGRAPAGLSLAVVDPGDSEPLTDTSAAKSGATATQASQSTAPVSTASATSQPTVYSRAAWGADERLRDCCVEYGEVHAGFVHHTVNANDYTRAEVPAILRGIYAYHTQSRGWRDIGYNFLVDKFGRIWEGRYGGISLPVVGAHTLGYNENSFAASAIGNFETAQPSAAVLDAYARLYAWKLSLHGVRPGTRQQVAGTTFDAISGHRDAAATACPGRYLYAKVPDIISKASTYQQPFSGRTPQRSFLRDSRPDVLLVSRVDGGVSSARGTGPPGFEPASPALPGFGGRDQISAVGDVTGDKLNDLMMRSAATGQTSVYPGRRDGTFAAALTASTRWARTDLFAGSGDVTGDGRADVVARNATSKDLLVYRGRGDGTFRDATVAIPALSGIDQLSAAGDFNRDGRRDLLARSNSGALMMLLGDGRGHFPFRLQLAARWAAYDVTMGGVDLTGDRWPDVVARDSATKALRVFANVEGERLSPAISRTPTALRPWSLTRDVTGDGRPDLVSVTAQGGLVLRPARRQNWLTPARDNSQTWAGVDSVMVVGDWNGDGYVDAMARERSTGTMWLYPGSSSGGFGARTQGWAGWSARSLITPVGDFDGDGRPDVLAKTSDGRVWLYPGRGLAGFGQPVIMRSSLPADAVVVSVGLWDSDGAPDVLVRTSTGAMSLYPGNGPGGLDDPVSMGSNLAQYNALLGAGDLTGDGRSDLLGRTSDGRVWLLAGRRISAKAPGGRFSERRYLGADWASYRLG
jgi:hypothetical protein